MYFFSRNPPLPKKGVTILGNVTFWGVTIMTAYSIFKSNFKNVFFNIERIEF